MDRRLVLAAYRLGFALLALVAVVAQFAHGARRDDFSPVNFLSFFTIQSNLLAIAALTLTGVRALRGQPSEAVLLRALATFCMTTTGIVYVTLLRGLEDTLQTPVPWINTVLHYVMPVVVLLDWVGDRPRPPLPSRRALLVLGYPVAWVVYSLVRGAIVGWYPYPFLDVDALGYAEVLLTCAVLAVAMVALVWVLARITHLGIEDAPASS